MDFKFPDCVDIYVNCTPGMSTFNEQEDFLVHVAIYRGQILTAIYVFDFLHNIFS